MSRVGRSERGQVIILFVVFFTMILVLLTFAVDQGFWYGRRRVVQKDADLAARAGALSYVGDSDPGRAQGWAEVAAANNGAADGVTASPASACETSNGSLTAPSVTVTIETQARGFFSLFFGADSIDVAARAVACVGSVDKLAVRDNGLAIPLNQTVGGARSCFAGGVLRLGRECAIFSSASDVGDELRRIFGDPNGVDCRGGNPDPDDIDDDVAFVCTTDTSRPNNEHRLRTELMDNGGDEYEDVLEAMRTRLRRSTGGCQSGNSASFQAAFGNGDGTPGDAPVPPPFGGSAQPDHVYVQNDCFNNPRIVVMPIIDDARRRNRVSRRCTSRAATGTIDRFPP